MKGLGFWGRGARFQCRQPWLPCPAHLDPVQRASLRARLQLRWPDFQRLPETLESLIQTGHQLINAVLNGAVHCPDH